MDGIRDSQRYIQMPQKDRDKEVLEIDKRREDDEEEEGRSGSEEEEEQEPQEPQETQQQVQPPVDQEDEAPAEPGQFEPFVSRGRTGLMDTVERRAISQICAGHPYDFIGTDQIAYELSLRGFDCYETEFDNKPGVRFDSGNLYVDSSGNHVLDLVDRDYTMSLNFIEVVFGVNMELLASIVQSQMSERDRQLITGMVNRYPPGMFEYHRTIRTFFDELDMKLAEKGYQGPPSIALYVQNKLEDILRAYEVPVTPIYNFEGQKLYAGEFAHKIMRAAMFIAALKQMEKTGRAPVTIEYCHT